MTMAIWTHTVWRCANALGAVDLMFGAICAAFFGIAQVFARSQEKFNMSKIFRNLQRSVLGILLSGFTGLVFEPAFASTIVATPNPITPVEFINVTAGSSATFTIQLTTVLDPGASLSSIGGFQVSGSPWFSLGASTCPSLSCTVDIVFTPLASGLVWARFDFAADTYDGKRIIVSTDVDVWGSAVEPVAAPTPLPSAIALFATVMGLPGIFTLARRKRRGMNRPAPCVGSA